MARKRKIDNEYITGNGCLESTSTPEKLHLHTNITNAMGPRNFKNSVKQNSNKVMLEKNPRVLNVVARRSERLKSSVSLSGNLLAEHVNLVENENEDEAPYNPQQVNTLPIVKNKSLEKEAHIESPLPEMNERRLEEKVDYLVTVADEFKSKILERPNECSSPDLRYKNMYFTSQKKIEALLEENYNLVRKLEFAHGKIAAYEAMKEMKDVAAKEVYVVSALGKATAEAAASLSPPPAAIPDDPKPKQCNPRKKIKS